MLYKISSTVFIFLLFFFSACSFLGTGAENESPTLTFSLPSSRALSSDATDEQYSLYIKLSGDSEQSGTVYIKSGATVTFDSLSIGDEITATAYVYYTSDEQKKYMYTGKTDVITIHEGENAVSLSLEYPWNYTLTLEANGGYFGDDKNNTSIPKQLEVDDDGKYYLPTADDINLERDGYDFASWAFSADGGKALDNGAEYVPVSDVTLYALWTKAAEEDNTNTSEATYTYTVILDANGGTYSDGNTTKTVGFNNLSLTNYTEYKTLFEAISEAGYDEDSAEYVPTLNGYTLRGYSANKNATDDSDLISKSTYAQYITTLLSAHTITLYAVWKNN